MTKIQIAVLIVAGLLVIGLIAGIVYVLSSQSIAVSPTLTPLASTSQPPTITFTSIVMPATWTPVPSAAQPVQAAATLKPSGTPFKTATIPISEIQTQMARNQATAGSGGVILQDKKCEQIFGSVVRITGTIKNNTDRTVGLVWMKGVIYDKNGKEISTSDGLANSNRIEPGKSATYEIFVTDTDKKFSTCSTELVKVPFE